MKNSPGQLHEPARGIVLMAYLLWIEKPADLAEFALMLE